ncbi:MAG: 3-(cis-5,6-dihydroxycyclohexa-1,3-dien-1-yl)propanoate dehydrogenase [Salinisphaera sp.]|nr:3-(cis-5,6-dihydroxycyclohexa-1,3-dien-1-yl)propanoate dehydrogenase [Salinisphaera sp.]
MGWLEGEVALITGGGSGLGLALARRFMQEGARVAIVERDQARLTAAQTELGDSLLACTGDVSRSADNEQAVSAVLQHFGRLDCFIANAGVFDFFKPLVDYGGDDLDRAFDELFAVNVKGAVLGARAALPALKQSAGSMIFTLSNAAFYPAGGGALYTASKHALTGVVRQLAYECAPTVRVNGVAPGGMRTGLRGLQATGSDAKKLEDVPDFEQLLQSVTPLALAPTPADYCGPYVLLASRSNAAPMTGVIINSDGGLGVRGLATVRGGS